MKTITYLLLIHAISSLISCSAKPDLIEDSHLILDEIVNDFKNNLPHFDLNSDTILIKFPDRKSLERTARCDYRYFDFAVGYSNSSITNLYLDNAPTKNRDWKKNYNLFIDHVCFHDGNYEIYLSMRKMYDEVQVYIYTYSKSEKRFISKNLEGLIIQ